MRAQGISGLQTRPGRARKPILQEVDLEQVKEPSRKTDSEFQ